MATGLLYLYTEDNAYVQHGKNRKEVADMLKYCAISALNGFIKDRGNCVKLSYDEKGMEEMVEYLKEITFDVKNYSYSADWALGKYYESKCRFCNFY